MVPIRKFELLTYALRIIPDYVQSIGGQVSGMIKNPITPYTRRGLAFSWAKVKPSKRRGCVRVCGVNMLHI